MNKYLIRVFTTWYGTDEVYLALAKYKSDLYNLAEELAYDNFTNYEIWNDDDDDESNYSWNIKLFEGTDEEFKTFGEPIIIVKENEQS